MSAAVCSWAYGPAHWEVIVSQRSALLKFLIAHPCLAHLSRRSRLTVNAALKKVAQRHAELFTTAFAQTHCLAISFFVAQESAGNILLVEGTLQRPRGGEPWEHFWNQIDDIPFDLSEACCEWSIRRGSPLLLREEDGKQALRPPLDRAEKEHFLQQLPFVFAPSARRPIRVMRAKDYRPK